MADVGYKLDTPDIENAEKGIYENLVVPNRLFLVEMYVTNLKHVINTQFNNVYLTASEKEKTLQERVDDIREKAVLKILSEAKALAEKGDIEYINKAGYAIEVSDEEILGIKNAKSRNWVCESALQIKKIYEQHKGVNSSGAEPETIELQPLDRKNDLDAICELILYDFSGETGYNYLKSNAQMLYNYLKVYYKGGIALENAFSETIEALRETAILHFVRDADKLAKEGNKKYMAMLQYAEDALNAEVGITYIIPEHKYTYDWFFGEFERLDYVYHKNMHNKRKK
jgi:hypothetical protein